MHHNRRPRPYYYNRDAQHHAHDNRIQSLYHRPVVDNINHHHLQSRNWDFSDKKNDWLGKDVGIFPGVLVEDDVGEDELTDSQKERKRQAPERGYDQQTQQMILHLHNMYRGNVTPPASDMRHMEWDDELAYLAQLWADTCEFEHGTPAGTQYSRLDQRGQIYGQNLYLGHEPTGENAMYLWYAEYKQFNYYTQYCTVMPHNDKCGHYVQMAQAQSDRLGCGMTKCNGRYLIVCHYYGPVIGRVPPYKTGQPCSQCPDERGSLCRNNLCFSWDQCHRNSHLCAEARCSLYCHNCGRLDTSACRCDCVDGFDSADCSSPCVDKHESCDQNPGYPVEMCASDEGIAKKLCRKMCGACIGIGSRYASKGLCCEGKVCQDGFVLDSYCNCTLLCPGPKCAGHSRGWQNAHPVEIIEPQIEHVQQPHQYAEKAPQRPHTQIKHIQQTFHEVTYEKLSGKPPLGFSIPNRAFYLFIFIFYSTHHKRTDRTFNNGNWRFHPHNHRRHSFHERSVVYRPQMSNFNHLQDSEGDWFDKVEPIESGVLVDDTPEEELTNLEKFRKREAPARGFYRETQQIILDLHNLYRSNVTPPASNMAHMEWDDELAYLAQLYADNCVFEHGTPPGTTYTRGIYGQNLYLGHDPTCINAMFLWYEEYRYYDLRTQYCQPRQQCGHYVQMAWGDSDRLGCGITKCGMRYLIVCHYHGPAIRGQQMYSVGKPCSQCSNEKGSLCRQNLCFTLEQCARLPNLCGEADCSLHCHNCGRLNATTCRCECADGYDSSDCSSPCKDAHERCGVNPGFPNKATCSMNRHAVAKKYCRKMCGECNPVVPGYSFKGTCCEGKVCQDGHVLDSNCGCTLLCPGPKCDTSSGFCLKSQALHLIFLIFLLNFLRFV
ncbi:hypothetical protein JTE90_000320 [Oedothorax gibbosus]|uniref:SCP domain-containing protein n=1 Tax=Oedothorax gibbosus TaxID=931172 RepID=A0AAV6VT76_9ARAC|nr:hypothetical protein JTE90_000320 [Oedothorax gibbosus]